MKEGDEGYEDHTDSALSAYDPYNKQRGIYKGIRLQEDANVKEQVRPCRVAAVLLSGPLADGLGSNVFIM